MKSGEQGHRGQPSLAGRLLRRTVWGVSGFILLAVLVFALGPTNEFGPNQPAARAAPPADLVALDGWLAQSEAAFPDIRPDNAKGVVWHQEERTRAPWAVVYLHGFTASRLETAPLAERIAEPLGAHVFYTRLAGHGRSSAAMGEATVQDWLADAQEALAIGRLLGERVLVVGVSTGATLATWLGQQASLSSPNDVFVFVSPNFGPADKRTELINGPWGQQIAFAVSGDTVGSPAGDPAQDNAWTRVYPTQALFPMMALVEHARESALAQWEAPLLVLYSEQDQTVDPAEIKAAFSRKGGSRNTLKVVDYSEAQGQHVLAGDLRAPQATQRMAQDIVEWVRSLN
jgi:alpha-beta hydrolase superfamily lysophospholipase